MTYSFFVVSSDSDIAGDAFSSSSSSNGTSSSETSSDESEISSDEGSADATLYQTLRAIGFTHYEISRFSNAVREKLVTEDMQDALEEELFTPLGIVTINEIADEENLSTEQLLGLNTVSFMKNAINSIKNLFNKVYTLLDIIEINSTAATLNIDPEFVLYLNSPSILAAIKKEAFTVHDFIDIYTRAKIYLDVAGADTTQSTQIIQRIMSDSVIAVIQKGAPPLMWVMDKHLEVDRYCASHPTIPETILDMLKKCFSNVALLKSMYHGECFSHDIIRIFSDPRVLLLDEAVQKKLLDPKIINACRNDAFLNAMFERERAPTPPSASDGHISKPATNFDGLFESRKRKADREVTRPDEQSGYILTRT